MRRQPILADDDARGLEARLHHPPTERSLRAPQEEDDAEPEPERPIDAPLPIEKKKRHQEHPAQHAPEHPMGPLPPIDALERGEPETAIDQLVLRRALIFRELRLPVGLRQRREYTPPPPPCGER